MRFVLQRWYCFISLGLCACLAPLGTISPVSAAESLTLVFNEKPPYFYTENGRPAGVLIDIARKVMSKAELDYRFESRPFSRIMHELELGQASYCAVGFSKIPERERYANFSLPLYKDRTPVLLVRRSDAAEFRRFKSTKEMLDGTTFVFGGKAGNSYPIDKQLESIGVRDIRVSGEVGTLVQMLNAGRFDFMMVYPEERDELIRSANLNGSSFVDISYPDMPDGGYRHLMCSKAIPAATLERINKAITSVVGKL